MGSRGYFVRIHAKAWQAEFTGFGDFQDLRVV
jgi:hypothetical protein